MYVLLGQEKIFVETNLAKYKYSHIIYVYMTSILPNEPIFIATCLWTRDEQFKIT